MRRWRLEVIIRIHRFGCIRSLRLGGASEGERELERQEEEDARTVEYQWYLGRRDVHPQRGQTALDESKGWPSLEGGSSGGSEPASGTKFTVVEDRIGGGVRGQGGESWADVLYSSSKDMQKRPEQQALETLRQQQQSRSPAGGRSPYEGAGGWDSQLFPVMSSSIPTSLLPWGPIMNSESGETMAPQGVVLGVSDFPGGYGDAKKGKPTPKERELMVWINSVRASPEIFDGAYVSRGCSLGEFGRRERTPQVPLHLSSALSQSAGRHSEDMAAENFVSHVGLGDSTPFERMDEAGYSRGYRGENICAGMKKQIQSY